MKLLGLREHSFGNEEDGRLTLAYDLDKPADERDVRLTLRNGDRYRAVLLDADEARQIGELCDTTFPGTGQVVESGFLDIGCDGGGSLSANYRNQIRDAEVSYCHGLDFRFATDDTSIKVFIDAHDAMKLGQATALAFPENAPAFRPKT